MQLTRHTDYGLRMLMFLGLSRPETATVGEVASALGLSAHHLMKVAQDLRRQDILIAHRGRSGGLELARDPADIRLGEVVRGLEGFRVVECFDEATNQCVLTPACGLHAVLDEALESFLAVLDRYTLADLLKKPKRMKDLIGL